MVTLIKGIFIIIAIIILINKKDAKKCRRNQRKLDPKGSIFFKIN